MRKLFIVVIILLLVLIGISLAKKEKQYTTIKYKITDGDTLWRIAGVYKPEDMDIRQMIYYIEEDNDITAMIYPDMIIKIRIYKEGGTEE